MDCRDDGLTGCAEVSASGSSFGLGPQLLASGVNSLHTTVPVSAYDGKTLRLAITGTDTRSATTVEVSPIYVESSLTLLDSAGTEVLDADSARTLYVGPGGLWLHDRSADTRSMAAFPAPIFWGRLHPRGAIVADQTIGVYDWRSGTVEDLGGSDRVSPGTAGRWAIWSVGTTVYRRDLLAGTTATVATNGGYTPDAVAPNGDVVYTSGPPSDRDVYDLYRYRDGATTRLTSDADAVHRNIHPVTDGTNVLYFKSDQNGSPGYAPGHIVLNRGGSETILSGPFGSVVPHLYYEANGGWIAWLVYEGSLTQVRTRSPEGLERQATFIGADAIRGLGPDGTLAFASRGSLYVTRVPYSAAPVRLSTDEARVGFRNTRLLLFLGNGVFDVNY